MQRCGFDPPLRTFSGRGDISLGVNMGFDSTTTTPPPTLSDEIINLGLVRVHMHFDGKSVTSICSVMFLSHHYICMFVYKVD